MSALSSNLEAVLPSQASTSGGWRGERERLHVPDLFQSIRGHHYLPSPSSLSSSSSTAGRCKGRCDEVHRRWALYVDFSTADKLASRWVVVVLDQEHYASHSKITTTVYTQTDNIAPIRLYLVCISRRGCKRGGILRHHCGSTQHRLLLSAIKTGYCI